MDRPYLTWNKSVQWAMNLYLHGTNGVHSNSYLPVDTHSAFAIDHLQHMKQHLTWSRAVKYSKYIEEVCEFQNAFPSLSTWLSLRCFRSWTGLRELSPNCFGESIRTNRNIFKNPFLFSHISNLPLTSLSNCNGLTRRQSAFYCYSDIGWAQLWLASRPIQ